MAVQNGPEAVQDIDVAVAVLVPEISTGSAIDHQRVDEVLDLRVEAGDYAAIRKDRAVSLGEVLRGMRLLVVLRDQIVEVLLLGRIEAGFCASLEGFEGHEDGLGRCRVGRSRRSRCGRY